MSSYQHRKTIKLDILVSVSGLLLALCFLILILLNEVEPKGIGLPLTLIASCLSYLYLKRKCSHNPFSETVSHGASTTFVLTNISFAALFAYSVYLVLASLYERPLLYFISVSLMSAIIAIETLILPERKNSFLIYGTLSKILLLASSVTWSSLFLFPSMVGYDSFFHVNFINKILESGFIPRGGMYSSPDFGSYSAFPLFHVETAVLRLVSSISSLKEVLFISIGLFEAASLLFVFLVCRSLLNSKMGLLATLMLGLSDYHISLGTMLIPTSLGLGFFAAIIYLLLNLKEKWEKYILIFLSFSAVILAHTITSFILLVALTSMFLGERFYFLVLKGRKPHYPRVAWRYLVLLFSVALVSYWIYTSEFFGRAIEKLYLIFSHAQISGLQYAPSYTLPQYEMNSMGMYILYWLAGIGLLTWLFQRNKGQLRFMLIATALALLMFPYGSLAIGSREIVPERWFAFIYIPLAMLAAQGLSRIVRPFRATSSKYAFTVVIISILSFFMISSSVGNIDNPLFAKGAAIRFAFTESEISGAVTFNSLYNGTVTTDKDYGVTYFNYTLDREFTNLDAEAVGGTNPVQGMIFMRTWTYNNPVEISTSNGSTTTIITTLRDFRGILENTMNKVFDNGGAEAYLSVSKDQG